MPRRLVVAVLLLVVVVVVVVALNGDRLYGWLLALHGAPAPH